MDQSPHLYYPECVTALHTIHKRLHCGSLGACMLTLTSSIKSLHTTLVPHLDKGELGCLPSGTLRDGADLAAGIYNSCPRLQQQLMERCLPEEFLKLLITHFLQGLHAAVIKCIGASAMTTLNMTILSTWKTEDMGSHSKQRLQQ